MKISCCTLAEAYKLRETSHLSGIYEGLGECPQNLTSRLSRTKSESLCMRYSVSHRQVCTGDDPRGIA